MSDLFPKLEPPPGGIARLRAALDASERPRFAWRPVLAAGVTVALLAVAVVFPRPRAVRLALLTAPAQPVVGRAGSAVQRVSESDSVVFYRVDSLVAANEAD